LPLALRSLTRHFPRTLKNLVPGYRDKWRHEFAALLHEIALVAPKLEFGEERGSPWIRSIETGVQLLGFWTEAKEDELFLNLRPDLPRGVPRGHFRLVKDFITRFRYPHLRPDLKLAGYATEQMHGFHFQHRDAIADLPAGTPVAELLAAFTPKPGDVIIDGGAFLGFGDIRVGIDVPDCRILAVEAAKSCHALLARNVELNRSGGITPVHNALWKDQSMIDLGTTYAQGNSLVGGELRERIQSTASELVAATTVDALVARFALPRVNMLSLTLNGAEPEALEGAAHTLMRYRPRIRAAGVYHRGGVRLSDIIRQYLEPRGYRVFIGRHGNTMAIPG